ncbi:hypothetical protein C8R45DRAFT_781921, partial [Mycena sanguinolenta]
ILIWILNALSPQDIRDRLMSPDSVFQKKIIAYLESAHQGDFVNGTLEDVKARRGKSFVLNPTPEEEDRESTTEYKVPLFTLPEVPPPLCERVHHKDETQGPCQRCEDWTNWVAKYEHEVDDIWLRTNLHNKGVCKARFPRDIFETTTVDLDGHINLKKNEAYLNTMSKVVTYFSRGNTDVTSLLSGTSVKAVVSYVSDYVSKQGLKTYQAFASVYDVFKK